MTRRVPARTAAASRLSVPRVRSSFVTANALSGLRRLRNPASAVIWCTITSAAAPCTAAITASRSSPSTITGCAPAARNCPALPGVLVVAVTSWPAATSPGTRCRPSAPVAPATNTRMTFSFRLVLSLEDQAPPEAVTFLQPRRPNGAGLLRPRPFQDRQLRPGAAARIAGAIHVSGGGSSVDEQVGDGDEGGFG